MQGLEMKTAALKIILIIIALSALLCSACSSTVESSADTEGGDEFGGEGDPAGGDGDDKDVVDREGVDDGIFQPPLLTDPDLLEDIFGEDMQSINIDFGDYFEGWHRPERPFTAYTFDSLEGARVTIMLESAQEETEPVVMLYGPQDFNGLWGYALTYNHGFEGSNKALIADFPIEETGNYLILVTTTDRSDNGQYFVSLGCRNQCIEPSCPDNTCQDFCENGFLLDNNGCQSCQCRIPQCSCETDADCPMGFYCEDCRCTIGTEQPDGDGDEIGGCECPPEYDPVCGEDGLTYTNRCEAECYDIEVEYEGPCEVEGEIPCELDIDCPPDMACVNFICEYGYDCGCPEYFNPVCGKNGKTYDNECELDCAAVDLAYWGACNGGNWNDDCMPVCMEDDNGTGWYDSCSGEFLLEDPRCIECQAVCQFPDTPNEGWYSSCGEALISYDDCALPCGCNDVWDPVCGSDSVTYINFCVASCEGVSIAYYGECETNPVGGCSDNSDCPPGFFCVFDDDCVEGDDPSECYGYCESMPTDEPCISDDDCPTGMVCEIECDDSDPEDGECYGICVTSNDAGDSCVVTGCNGEICSDWYEQSDCEWLAEFACLDFAVCAPDESGACAWQETGEYNACMEGIDNAQTCTNDSDCPASFWCYEGYCMQSSCDCPEVSDPVCGSDGQTYINPCQAVCKGADVIYFGECQ